MALITQPEIDGKITPLDQEATYLAELDQLPRAAVDLVGTSTEGRPLRLIRIGYPEPLPVAESLAPLFIIATQHGDERSPRETALALARDLAQSTDPAVIQYLTNHSVLIMPTPNPDAWAAATRTTPAGINMNRVHLSLEIPEAMAVAKVLRDAGVQVGLDMHESMGGGSGDDGQVGAGGPAPNVHPNIRAINEHLEYLALRAIRAGGWTAAPYEHASATGDLPGVLDNAMSHRFILSLVLELKTANPMTTRIAITRAMVDAVIKWHGANAAMVTAAADAARRDKMREARTQSRPFALKGAGFRLINPPVTGYQLSANQISAVQPLLDAHGILVENGTVWTHQETQALIPYLLDEQSDFAVTPTQRRYTPAYSRRMETWMGSRWRSTILREANGRALTPKP